MAAKAQTIRKQRRQPRWILRGLQRKSENAGSLKTGKSRVLPLMITCLAVVLVFGTPAAVIASDFGEGSGMQLTSPVRQQLKKLRDAWTGWTRAYLQDDVEEAESYLEQMLAISSHLELPRLPDLAAAAAAYAVQSAREGNRTRSDWALEAARRLDSGAAETEFAAATIHWNAGEFVGALLNAAQGYRVLLSSRFESRLAIRSLSLWVVYTILACSAVFFVLLFICLGPKLVGELIGAFSARFSPNVAVVATLVTLLWPLMVPRGLLWIILYWSVLIWTYCSLSQRLVLICIWAIGGLAPIGIAVQQRGVQLDLVPPTRLIENLKAGRLYGNIFTDLQVLRSLLPEDEIVFEMVADLHRKLGQWEHARSQYTRLIESPGLAEEQKANALCNIGVYHQRKAEYGTAVNYFKRASEANARLPEVFYNLSQAYSQLYEFANTHQSKSRARELAAASVDEWDSIDRTPEQAAVAVDGGLRQSASIYSALESTWGDPEGQARSTSRNWSLSLLALVIASALSIDLLRRNVGSLEIDEQEKRQIRQPFLRVLTPGLSSAFEGRGWRSFASVLVPGGCAMAWQIRGLTLRSPLGIEPDRGILLLILGIVLGVWLVGRIGVEWIRSSP